MPAEGPLADFFNSYDGFIYNPQKPAIKEFDRLCSMRQWDKPSKKKANKLFKIALARQFNMSYGTDENSLAAWHDICARIRIDPIPGSIEECKEAVQRRNVNLVDLLDAYDGHRHVKLFKTQKALSKYTLRSKKVFPRNAIGAGDLLKYLLRQITNPPD